MMLTGLKAQATEYVTDVMVIGAYSSSEVSSLASTYQAQGWKLIDYDLVDYVEDIVNTLSEVYGDSFYYELATSFNN